jgi:hypothetical protein
MADIGIVLKKYPFGRIQDLLVLYELLRRDGIDIDDLLEYVAARREAIARSVQMRSAVVSRQCPDCGHRMPLLPVNTGPWDQTGDDSTFVWICPACRNEEWTNKPLRKIIHDLHGGRAPKPATQRTHHRGRPSRRWRRR